MSATTTDTIWFLGARVRVLARSEDGDDGLSLLEMESSTHLPPLHVHRSQDELFHLLEGQIRFALGGDERLLEAGESVLAPKGVPHAFRIESASARWLVATAGGDFEAFVHDVAAPPEEEPAPERLMAAAAARGIEIVGPPLA